MSESKEKVVIAMSGGVDSSVCASLMVKKGYECVGMTMRLWKGPEVEETECSTQSCCGAESVEDARLVAEELKIPYYAINFKEEFWEKVVTKFADEYFAGRTPSPCILCNEKLKFDTLYKKAMEIGASKICTGHYARIEYDEETGRWVLMRGKDPKKDQTYFLFSMTQEQLSKTLFPVGDFTKDEIRKLARADDLVTAQKPESQDICFIPDGNYAKFLERHFPEKAKAAAGKIKHVDGQELGDHKGIHSVTIGQRKGLGVAFGQPLYVTRIDSQTKDVYVGSQSDANRKEFLIERVNWILKEGVPGECHTATIKIRSRSPEKPGKIYPLEGGGAHVVFDEPQNAITPGQACVFYIGDKVLGGGWIEKVSDC
ncbi:MAG: tRNA-specific 2-thiouridylase MnmA [Chlamydiae bacterium]|nr:tRNA-specific 2-thiouridylase MnmA [Chlamydiota bacterium]